MKLLQIDSSALGANSATRELTAALVELQRQRVPALHLIRRDLDAAPLPHLSAATLADPEAAIQSQEVLDEFLAADTVVIGAPMYNFGIPSTLKAWMDRITVAGRTFRYTATGPEGLVRGKTVILAIAAGGMHAGQATDFVEPYLRQVFGFLGVTDLHVVRADGVALSPEDRRRAIADAIGSAEFRPQRAA
ncbi:FMN-dependent NADH-azoreductase [Lysobacter xanthus]